MANAISSDQHARQEVSRSKKRESSAVFGVFVVVTVAIIGFLFWLKPAIDRAQGYTQLMELRQLEVALRNYETQFGEYPPDSTIAEIERHVQRSFQPPIDFAKVRDRFPHRLEALDECETLCFWLSGFAWQTMTGKLDQFEMYDFGSLRTTDRDRDGWVEFVDNSGNYFVFRNGRPGVLDASTNAVYTADDLVERYEFSNE